MTSPSVGVVPTAMLVYKGDIEIGLKYVTAESLSDRTKSTVVRGELQLLVKLARNLTGHQPNTFCKALVLLF